jgi:hypothetical protein
VDSTASSLLPHLRRARDFADRYFAEPLDLAEDIVRVRDSCDLVELMEEDVALRQESASTSVGTCPWCRAAAEFHVERMGSTLPYAFRRT